MRSILVGTAALATAWSPYAAAQLAPQSALLVGPSAALAPGATTTPALADSQSSAQTSTSAPAPDVDEGDIIVTARRRDENLQKVPVAVSAFTGEKLVQLNVNNNSDLSHFVPSLFVDQGGFGSNSSNLSLRGITTPGANISFDPTIGVYVNDVYLARNYGSLFDFFDVSNVQVLRGVQGTLFGRNNTGGAILVTTAKPEWKDSISGAIGYGNYNYMRANAVGNLVIAPDLLAIRIGGQTTLRDGYGVNVVNGQRLANKDSQEFRFSVLLTPSSNTEFNFIYNYGQHDENGVIDSPRSPTGRTVQPGLGWFEVAYDSPPQRDFGFDQSLTGIAKIDLGAVQVKLIGNHLFASNTVALDVDATNSGANIYYLRGARTSQNSAELQLSGKLFDGSLSWLAGAYHLDEKGYQPTQTVLAGTETRLSIDNSSDALFGHVDLSLSDKLHLGVGARETRDTKGETYGSFNVTTNLCIPASAAVQASPGYNTSTCLVTLGKQKSFFSWDATADYQLTPTVMVYARTGKGQKSGGYNSGITNAADLIGYEPEVATDYEIGAKTQFFDRRVRLNLALFQTNYKNIQRSALVLVGGSTVVTVSNAASARIRGGEVELNANVTSRLNLNVNYSHIDPKYLAFFVRNAAGNLVDQSNFPFSYVSKDQVTASVTYKLDVPGFGTFRPNATYAYRAGYQTASGIDPLTMQPGYGLVSGNIAYSPAGMSNFEISAWVRNLTDQKYITHGASSGSIRYVVPGLPRMFGVDFRFKFGG